LDFRTGIRGDEIMRKTLIDEVTLCITSGGEYPLLESCVCSIKRFYPDLKIIISFDCNKQNINLVKRKKFFSKFNNITFLEDKFFNDCSKQMDRIKNNIKTKYFIFCDEDVFFKRKGVLEFLSSRLQEKDYCAIGHLGGHYFDDRQNFLTHGYFLQFFILYKTEIFEKYKMKFKRMRELDYSDEMEEEQRIFGGKINSKKILYYDTGSFIFVDFLKNDLDFLHISKEDLFRFLNHYGRLGSFEFFRNEEIIYPTVESGNLLKMEERFFNFNEIEEEYREKIKLFILDNNSLFHD
jgi:hypothetical protein